MLTLLGELLAATADAHSPRRLVRAFAETLATQLPVTRVELRAPAPTAVAQLSGSTWRCDDALPHPSSLELLAPGLAVLTRGPIPERWRDPAVREALAQIVLAATRHLDVVQRVAKLSRRALAENRELRADVERLAGQGAIVARSSAMRAALARVALVARHPTTVLLTGESGTGKEVLARELHRLSPRAHRPMVHVNCGAIPEHLVESELFGHERGAFTGADRVHVGLFERAHRGTVFLDEVGELPMAAQVKLLRVLQERQLRRVGGEAQIDVDVRLLAATNRSLLALVAAGRFREDLLYRLDVFSIVVPPLRQRRGDLAPLVAALVQELAVRLRVPAVPITRADLQRLEAHAWPGNVRELMNVLEAAMILGDGLRLVLPEDLPRATRASPGDGDSLRFDHSVRVAIETALQATSGKIYGVGGAASRLGLKPGTLQSKMRKLGIDRTRFL
ncbi:MAG: sigma-54 dependent transcriptional regulator [Myxococcota bacterium]|nr:sigma-54 dependent transcriptional regulator [Myxococcota bacterium]